MRPPKPWPVRGRAPTRGPFSPSLPRPSLVEPSRLGAAYRRCSVAVPHGRAPGVGEGFGTVTTAAPPPPIGPGTRVLVTGAASGLGASLRDQMRRRGARVLATDVRGEVGWDESGDPVPQDAVRRLDITSELDWADAARWVQRELGGLDVLVNNAGVAGGGRIECCPSRSGGGHRGQPLRRRPRVRAFTPMFKQQRSGLVVNVASLAALVHPAGMASTTRRSQRCWRSPRPWQRRRRGVTPAVCPSYFRTNLMASMQGADEAVGRVIAGLVDSAPLGADEIAAAVLEGLEAGPRGQILPDAAARQAYGLKRSDRAASGQTHAGAGARAATRPRPRPRRGARRSPMTSSGAQPRPGARRGSRRTRRGHLRRRGGDVLAAGAHLAAGCRGHDGDAAGAAVQRRRLQPHVPAAVPRPRPDPATSSASTKARRVPMTWVGSIASRQPWRRCSPTSSGWSACARTPR